MSRWTYYCPLWVGALLALPLHQTIAESWPGLPPKMYWPYVCAVSIVAGGICQLMLIGAQGAFAQVLPAPGGRSIRGRGAAVAGALLMLGLTVAVAAVLLASEAFGAGAWIVGALAGTLLIASVVTYAWCWPAAVRDFADER
ncbi:MAG: hypothetical protein HRF50_06935 [Phycisphaerae bacterium]|jgi:hypothetical protein